MPLDANLFVLCIFPRPNVVGTLDFREEGKLENSYTAVKDGDKIMLLDPWTDDTLYASLTVLGPKLRLVTFVSPDSTAELKNVSNFGWCWSFELEDHKFVWERAATSLLGADRSYTLSVSMKPDPDFPVCIFSPASKRKPSTVQLLDYNLCRIDPPINDKKGFEIMTILSLLSFLDTLFLGPPGTSPSASARAGDMDPLTEAHLARTRLASGGSGAAVTNGMAALAIGGSQPEPPTPPRRASAGATPARNAAPSPMTGLSSNELEVRDPSARELDAARCLKLLEDDQLLYVLLIGQSASIVPHVVALAELVKRQRYKASGEELKQFIDDGPASAGAKYATPSSIKVYLSRIELADLLPNYKPKTAVPKPPIRPAINFDLPSPGSSGPSPPPPPKLKKGGGGKEEGGGGGWFSRSK